MFIDALEKSLGIMSSASKAVGINRVTAYKWMQKDKEFAERVASIVETTIDFVESKLFEQIAEGNTTAIIFYLKTKAKHRGYVEQVDHTIRTFEIDFTED